MSTETNATTASARFRNAFKSLKQAGQEIGTVAKTGFKGASAELRGLASDVRQDVKTAVAHVVEVDGIEAEDLALSQGHTPEQAAAIKWFTMENHPLAAKPPTLDEDGGPEARA